MFGDGGEAPKDEPFVVQIIHIREQVKAGTQRRLRLVMSDTESAAFGILDPSEFCSHHLVTMKMLICHRT